MTEPNFFLVGAPKAGTTSLNHVLRQHPDIYMSPIKEPCHFSNEVRPENFSPGLRPRGERVERETLDYLQGNMERPRTGGIVREWKDYLRLFGAARDQRAVGEASVCYMVSASAARGIAERIPLAKILMVLRSPAERAFSHYLHLVSDGLVRCSFRDYVGACLRHEEDRIGVYRPFLEMGYYAAQLQRFLRYFPRDQIGIWIYEEALLRPDEFRRQVFRFLGVDDRFEPEPTARHHEPRIPRWVAASKPLHWVRMNKLRETLPASWRATIRDAVYRPNRTVRMDTSDRSMMLDFYRDDIRRLEGILGRNLDLWMEGNGVKGQTGAWA